MRIEIIAWVLLKSIWLFLSACGGQNAFCEWTRDTLARAHTHAHHTNQFITYIKAHDHRPYTQCTWRIFQTRRDDERQERRRKHEKKNTEWEKDEEVWKLNQGNECAASNVHYAIVMKITQWKMYARARVRASEWERVWFAGWAHSFCRHFLFCSGHLNRMKKMQQKRKINSPIQNGNVASGRRGKSDLQWKRTATRYRDTVLDCCVSLVQQWDC